MTDKNAAAEQAYGTIVAQLAAPYFFEKLAANGIQPRTEKEAAEMWEAATKLHVLYTAEQEKAAAVRASDMSAMNSQLDQLLVSAGLAQGGVPETAAVFKQAAVVAAEQPEIATAVLTLQAAAAASLQNAE
jgi:hypothetical protein